MTNFLTLHWDNQLGTSKLRWLELAVELSAQPWGNKQVSPVSEAMLFFCFLGHIVISSITDSLENLATTFCGVFLRFRILALLICYDLLPSQLGVEIVTFWGNCGWARQTGKTGIGFSLGALVPFFSPEVTHDSIPIEWFMTLPTQENT